MAHKHIGPEDWPVIARMLKAGFSGSEIARTLGKDPSAVNRHVKQNGGRDGYDVREVRRRGNGDRDNIIEKSEKGKWGQGQYYWGEMGTGKWGQGQYY